MYRKTEQITIRVNPILKDKFIVAIWFLDISAVLLEFMQTYVREYEKHILVAKPIPTRTDKQWIYDIITKIHGVKLSPERYDEMLSLYPKTKKNIAIYWD